MIIWLASYPKSGNPWLRMFLKSYFMKSDEKFISKTYKDENGKWVFPEDVGKENNQLIHKYILFHYWSLCMKDNLHKSFLF